MQGATLQSGHNFAQLPRQPHARSAFDRSARWGGTFDAGWLIPFFHTTVFPGDTLSVSASFMARIATLLFPIMDRLFLDAHFWFVPYRLLYDNWERMNGQQDSPSDSTDYTTPQIAWTTPSPVTVGSLFDYFFWRPGLTNVSLAAWKARAYNKIYFDQYKDENLIDAPPLHTGNGPDDPADYTLLRRGKRHDYFTSAAKAPQKGNAVTLPIALSAPVVGLGSTTFPETYVDALRVYGGAGPVDTIFTWDPAGASANVLGAQSTAGFSAPGPYNAALGIPTTPMSVSPGTFAADLSSATGISINDFRYAVTLQQYLELNMRGGTRYGEKNLAHFGVSNPDARFQRAEFLGGGTFPLNVHQVAQTAPVASPTPNAAPGNLAAYGVVAGRGASFTQSFTEHGIVMGILSVRADYTYSQGVPREDRYLTMFDYYDPLFANLGEQPIRKQEIYAQGGAVDDETWGWQERWAEMRYYPSQLVGLMRPEVAGSVGAAWTVAQAFASLPGLNQEFIEENPPVDRVIAVPSQPHFICDAQIQQRAVRVMPQYSIPGLTRI